MAMTRTQNGSVFFYILLGVVLFATLSYVVANMIRSGGDLGGAEQARLQAQALVDLAQKAKIVVQDMKLSGISTDQISFLKEGDAGYATAPHTAKVFHPSGGDLRIPDFTDAYTQTAEVRMNRVAMPDMGTAAVDIVFGIRYVKQAVCAEINKKLRGSDTIPSESALFSDAFDVSSDGDWSGGGDCTSCSYVPSQCFRSSGGDYIFYSVVDPN